MGSTLKSVCYVKYKALAGKQGKSTCTAETSSTGRGLVLRMCYKLEFHMQGHSAQKGASIGRGDLPRKRFLLGDIPMLPSLCHDEPEAALASPRLLSCLLALTPPADAAACTLRMRVDVSLQIHSDFRSARICRHTFHSAEKGPTSATEMSARSVSTIF